MISHVALVTLFMGSLVLMGIVAIVFWSVFMHIEQLYLAIGPEPAGVLFFGSLLATLFAASIASYLTVKVAQS